MKITKAELLRKLRKRYSLRNLEVTSEEGKKLRGSKAREAISKELSKYRDPRTRAKEMREKFKLKPRKVAEIEEAGYKREQEKSTSTEEKIKAKIASREASGRLIDLRQERLRGGRTRKEIISDVHGGREKGMEKIGVKRRSGLTFASGPGTHAADDYPGNISTGTRQNPSAGGGSIEGRPGMMPAGGGMPGAVAGDSGANKGELPPISRSKDPLAGKTGLSKPPDSGIPKGNSLFRKVGNPK